MQTEILVSAGGLFGFYTRVKSRDAGYSERHLTLISGSSRAESLGTLVGDRLLMPEEEPPLGAHLVTPRRGFTHHGIYVARGNVVHYRSAVRELCRGTVEEISLARFAQGGTIWIRSYAASRFLGAEVARRACARIGEDRYRLLTNNCEHFCEWCVHGEQRSFQVEYLLALPRFLTRACGRIAAALVSAGSGIPNLLVRVLPTSSPRTQHASLGRQSLIAGHFLPRQPREKW